MTNNDYNLLQLLAQVSRAGKQQESCIETEDGAFTTHASHPRFPTRHKVHLAWVKVGVSFIFADMIFYFAEGERKNISPRRIHDSTRSLHFSMEFGSKSPT